MRSREFSLSFSGIQHSIEQLGGKYTAYVPSYADTALLASIKTRFYFKMRSKSMLPSEGMHEQLVSHFDHLQRFANANPATTGTGIYPYTDRLKQASMTPTMPYLYNGLMPILVTFGKDISMEDYIGENSFLGANLRQGCSTETSSADLLNLRSNHGQAWSDARFNPLLFPFVGLWPFGFFMMTHPMQLQVFSTEFAFIYDFS
jgi:hypothetical protein